MSAVFYYLVSPRLLFSAQLRERKQHEDEIIAALDRAFAPLRRSGLPYRELAALPAETSSSEKPIRSRRAPATP
ncbi:hypothetical protein [Nannocystis pusilla]|uniref:hypothetical protein n=1 Tax=Nannocystis pusilla TaxID=889268 RepID=UPI003DA29FC5